MIISPAIFLSINSDTVKHQRYHAKSRATKDTILLTNQLINTFVTRQASPSHHRLGRRSTGLTVLERKVLENESKMENKTKVTCLKLLKHEKRGSKNEIWFEYQLDESLETNCRENLSTLKKGMSHKL